MATSLGYNTVVSIGSAFDEVWPCDGIDSVTLNHETNILDATVFATTSFRKKKAGLTDFTLDVSGHFNPGVSGAEGVGTLMTCLRPGAPVWFRFTTDAGTTIGYQSMAEGYGAQIKSFKVEASVGDTTKVSANIVGCNTLEEFGTAD